jgi:DNA-binding LacI/PurR family transcriptional regulator
MPKTATKFNYLVQMISSAVTGGDYLQKPFPSERALAMETGMSLSTVRKAVIHCVEKGYLSRNPISGQPEIHPNYLKNKPHKSVAVILPAFPAQSHTEWYGAVEKVCSDLHFNISMISYHNQEDPTLFRHLNTPYDFIFMLPPTGPSSFLLSQMKKNAERLITFFQDYTNLGISTICDPPAGLMRILLDHLYEKNCRRIDCVNATPMPHKMVSDQITVWKKFLTDHKCSGTRIDQTHSDPSYPYYLLAREAIRTHLKKHRVPDAFICTTGVAAIGVVRGLADCSIRAGLDVKVAATTTNHLLQELTPSITCMKPIGREDLIRTALQKNRPLHIGSKQIHLFIGESTQIASTTTQPPP